MPFFFAITIRPHYVPSSSEQTELEIKQKPSEVISRHVCWLKTNGEKSGDVPNVFREIGCVVGVCDDCFDDVFLWVCLVGFDFCGGCVFLGSFIKCVACRLILLIGEEYRLSE